MHDPLTQAFRIPFLGLTIWHVDPEKRGDDDSCDWFGRYRPLNAREDALLDAVYALEPTLDNPPHYPDSREHHEYQLLKTAVAKWRRRSKWRLPVRWHIWHWRFQFEWLLDIKRWLFSRCCVCDQRFTFGYSPCSGDWNGSGPRWFRGEAHVYHRECDAR